MKGRLRALLVHGMGSSPEWWNPLITPLQNLGLEPVVLEMPSLESSGPVAWVDEIVRHAGHAPVLLIGHSLGAAVCVVASRRIPCIGIILLACPPFFDDYGPSPPVGTGLSVRAVTRVGMFLRDAAREAALVTTDSIHFIGDADPFIPAEQAARLPFPLIVIPSADHDLRDSMRFMKALIAHIINSQFGKHFLDPAVRAPSRLRASGVLGEVMDLNEAAPPPARIDLEITTRCQCACPRCARTLFPILARPIDMSRVLFERVIGECSGAGEIIFVGLGEPLLHPDLPFFVSTCARLQMNVSVVTNGLMAEPHLVETLFESGLGEITFSIDSADPERFRLLRGGADLRRVLANFRAVREGRHKSIFVTLSRQNVGDLRGLVDLAVNEGLRAIAVSDVNFPENADESLRKTQAEMELGAAITYARERNVLLIDPRFHNIGDPRRRHLRCTARKPADIMGRSCRHRHCLAPWRIAVVGVKGDLTPCNCAPQTPLGNLARDSMAAVWNGPGMAIWRKAVVSGQCHPCLTCPRY